MIVRPARGALHLITQPEHAALSGRLMAHWTPLEGEARRRSILLAIDQHDNGWIEPDGAPAVDPATGRIRDFMSAPAAVRQGVWPRALTRLSHDPWAGALVAQHAVTVYDRYRGDPAWVGFFDQMTAARERLLGAAGVRAAASGLPASRLRHDYTYVRIGDLISLIFCNAWTETLTYREWTFRLDGNQVLVSPDGFGGSEVTFGVPAVEIPDRAYASDADLQAAVRDGRRVMLSGSCRGA